MFFISKIANVSDIMLIIPFPCCTCMYILVCIYKENTYIYLSMSVFTYTIVYRYVYCIYCSTGFISRLDNSHPSSVPSVYVHIVSACMHSIHLSTEFFNTVSVYLPSLSIYLQRTSIYSIHE